MPLARTDEGRRGDEEGGTGEAHGDSLLLGEGKSCDKVAPADWGRCNHGDSDLTCGLLGGRSGAGLGGRAGLLDAGSEGLSSTSGDGASLLVLG